MNGDELSLSLARDASWIAPSPRRGRRAKGALERAVECRLGIVAAVLRDAGEAGGFVAQALSGDGEPPAGQVLYGRLPDDVGEALGQRRSRQSDLLGELLHRPR